MHVHPKRQILYRIYVTLVDFNDHNSAPLYNEKIQQAISKVIAEEEADARNINLDAQNVTMNNFCHSPVTTNTQRENTNTILTSERINYLDVLAETLRGLTINNAGYYHLYKNDAEADPASNPKVATHTSDEKNKVTDTTNENLQQKLLINRTLPIITMTIDTRITDRVANCGGTPHAHTTTTTKPVITDVARSRAHIIWTP